jgi:FtsH-binding integral membrane protein
MKTVNKKAILGMLVAMIMSLGVLQGMGVQKQSESANLQQAWTVACYQSEASLSHQVMGCIVSAGIGFAFGNVAGLVVAL